MASYSFVDSIRHCIEDTQGDVILTNCNAGKLYSLQSPIYGLNQAIDAYYMHQYPILRYPAFYICDYLS